MILTKFITSGKYICGCRCSLQLFKMPLNISEIWPTNYTCYPDLVKENLDFIILFQIQVIPKRDDLLNQLNKRKRKVGKPGQREPIGLLRNSPSCTYHELLLWYLLVRELGWLASLERIHICEVEIGTHPSGRRTN